MWYRTLHVQLYRLFESYENYMKYKRYIYLLYFNFICNIFLISLPHNALHQMTTSGGNKQSPKGAEYATEVIVGLLCKQGI